MGIPGHVVGRKHLECDGGGEKDILSVIIDERK
jgi:hypothetical protein